MRKWATATVLAVVATTARAQVSDLLRSQLAQSAAQRAPGAVPVGAPFGGFLASRQALTQYVTMQAGRCYTILGVGGQGVADLDLALFDPNGKRAATDLGFDPTPSVQHCARWPGAYKLEAKVKRGAGEVAVQLFVAGGASAMPPPPSGPDALGAHVDSQAAALAPGAARVGNLYAAMAPKGQKNDWFVPLEGGRCYIFIAAGGAGVQYLSQFLWDPSGRRVTDHKSKSAESIMSFCPTFPGPYHLQAKVEKGGGEIRVGVYAKAP